jgi:multicomponent Na+:H+ antiporter subunit G
MVVVNGIVTLFLAGGLFFTFVGSIGLLRFPDFYTRLHATGKCDTLGAGLILIGLIIHHFFHYSGTPLVPVRLIFLVFFIFIANPAATHALMKAGYEVGVKPWKLGDERR